MIHKIKKLNIIVAFDIAAMSLFNDGTFVPVSILNQNGYLSTDWTPDEIATSYAVLAD